ncbi:MAG: RluA family pseudouridine synthase [Solirubrobacterales bacterium]|nr:RluA family pseudouridine synthase [Solirubrobacterales bacterium]
MDGERAGGSSAEAPHTPAQRPLVLHVPDAAAGARLDQFLAERVGSRAQAQALIDAGKVTVDGRAQRKRHLVAPGEVVAVLPRDPPAPVGEARATFAIAYDDDHLLVVDKPAGVVVHPARGNRTGTLAQALSGLAAGGEDARRAGIVHRLDRDTSGLLVVAKNDAVHRALKALLQTRRLEREYLALVEGRLDARTGTIDAPVGRSRQDRVLMSIDSTAAREARTHFTVRRLLPRCTLVSVGLETGRTHQIRVHMKAIGHPVCGDVSYGGRSVYGLKRQFLHAARLRFPHPVTGQELDVRSPLPADLAAALRLAEQDR